MRRRQLDNCEQHHRELSSNKFIKLKHKNDQSSIIDSSRSNENTQIISDDDSKDIIEPQNDNSTVSGRHLVRKISDLPVFVPIEGYRIAAYMIDGEYHLCLPQLLQNIRQEFQLNKVVEIFEETITVFSPATPKQVEGFIKSSVLPPNATSCFLIRRSTADRVCLKLFDQVSQESNDNCIIDLGSNLSSSKSVSSTDKDDVRKNFNANLMRVVDARDRSGPIDHNKSKEVDSSADRNEPASDSSAINFESKSSSFGIGVAFEENKDFPSLYNTELDKQRLEKSGETGVKLEQSTCKHQLSPNDVFPKASEKPNTFSETRSQLFEMEAQNTILDFARAATSTLMIQIYHKCFGKCKGFYYPSLLKNFKSQCIECACCHVMLSPRRFIGHIHNNREVNVCQWGFNSYNWRHYIKLSKRQSMNNLDDDELLIRFNQLISIPDYDDEFPSIDERYEKIGIDLASSNVSQSEASNTSRSLQLSQLNRNESVTYLHETINSSIEKDREKLRGAISTGFINSTDSCTDTQFKSIRGSHSVNLDHPISFSSPRRSIGAAFPQSAMQNPISNASGSSSKSHCQFSSIHFPKSYVVHSNTHSSMPSSSPAHFLRHQQLPMSNPIAPSTTVKNSNPTCTKSTSTSSLGTNYPSSLSAPISSYGGNFRHPTIDFGLCEQLRSNSQIHVDREKDLQRDLYVSTNLATYLSSRHVDTNLSKEIIACTLDFIDRSRKLY